MGESAWYKYSGEIIITNVDMLESGSDLDSEERGGEGRDRARYGQIYPDLGKQPQ